jgi:hypothetical protein
MGLLAPHLSWVSGALRHFLAYCLVDEATKYGGILTFIDDAFSNPRSRFGTRVPSFEQSFKDGMIKCLDLEKILCLKSRAQMCLILISPLPFLLHD